tara:strand:+ start:517 stop:1116 length:600 start_codon:yes stop_codon:yes gene_type:complete
MKRLLVYLFLVLGLGLVTNVKADDIRDLQIEGMSIGDSLLDYYSEKEIKTNITDVYSYKKDKTFVMAAFDTLEGYNFSKYEAVQIEFKKNDKNYIIHGVTGKVFSNYDKDIEACFEHQDKVINELTQMFKNQKKDPVQIIKHRADKSGKSKVRQAAFIFKQSGDLVLIECYDWHKNMPYQSNFKVVLSTKELDDWLIAK